MKVTELKWDGNHDVLNAVVNRFYHP